MNCWVDMVKIAFIDNGLDKLIIKAVVRLSSVIERHSIA
jgi:hypothetical protein